LIPTSRATSRIDRPCRCREPGHVMRPARTRVRDPRAGLVAAVGWLRRGVRECGQRRMLV
jgi:hypothetical protein